MKVVIPGGLGQVGTILARGFQERGDEVVVLSRTAVARPWRVVPWDGQTVSDWAREIDGADVVINLAGRSVNCRYTATHRAEIMQSRVLSTRVVGSAIAAATKPPHTWLQASTATVYAHRFDADNDEVSGIIGGHETDVPRSWDFSIEVATNWERELAKATTPGTRKVAMRSAVVMSPDRGGIFDTLLTLVRRGLGGTSGDGRQYVSWMHDVDFVRAIDWLIEHREIDSPVNLSSPHPLPNASFMRALRSAWGTSIGLPATTWMLELGTFLMRTETELVLKSRRVVPARLLQSGFTFRYPEWPTAARDLVLRWRSGGSASAR
jgi:uncharacterized protein (TIGR01777 family)